MTTSIEVVEVTPAMASHWLETNRVNRAVRQGAVREYAIDMASGRWVFTHQGIAFDDAGELIDGQHRLLAIVQSGCTVRMVVTRGLDPAARRDVDRHAKRTPYDAVSLANPSRSTTREAVSVAAAIATDGGFKDFVVPLWLLEQLLESSEWGPAVLEAGAEAKRVRNCQIHGLSFVQTWAVVARLRVAGYVEPLRRVADRLIDGQAECGTGLHTLRQWLLRQGRVGGRGGMGWRTKVHHASAVALSCQVLGRRVGVIRETMSPAIRLPVPSEVLAFVGRRSRGG